MALKKFNISLFFSKSDLVDAGQGYRVSPFVKSVRRSDERLKKALTRYGYDENEFVSVIEASHGNRAEPQIESKR
ncbi:hypothetical protein D3C87_351700 [compost metagenome]